MRDDSMVGINENGLTGLWMLIQAAYFRTHLRVLAAGGDGTVAWILGTIAELGLDPAPHVAVGFEEPSSSFT